MTTMNMKTDNPIINIFKLGNTRNKFNHNNIDMNIYNDYYQKN